jgi:hypothetical protein
MYTKRIPTHEHVEFIVRALTKPIVRGAYALSLAFIYLLLKGIQWYLDRTDAIRNNEPVNDEPVNDEPTIPMLEAEPATESMPPAKQTRRTKKGAV